jgi:hypothetical protein
LEELRLNRVLFFRVLFFDVSCESISGRSRVIRVKEVLAPERGGALWTGKDFVVGTNVPLQTVIVCPKTAFLTD